MLAEEDIGTQWVKVGWKQDTNVKCDLLLGFIWDLYQHYNLDMLINGSNEAQVVAWQMSCIGQIFIMPLK